MQYKLQPQERADMTLPYPYFIDEHGNVGRQDFWKGRPRKLIGFANGIKAFVIDLSLRDFKEEPQKAVGMFPVFSDADDNWWTHTESIATVTVKE